MGDGKADAPFEQAQACVGEPRIEAFAISAIAIQVQGDGLALVFATGHQADRHAGAIGGGGPESLADIGIGVERSEHGRFFQDVLFAIAQG
ncbi:hypothetical protein D3C86_1824300 [compost metagenome]